MKQTVAERRLHHQTREDRQRKVYEVLQRRIRLGGRVSRTGYHYEFNVEAARRDAANLARKLNIEQ